MREKSWAAEWADRLTEPLVEPRHGRPKIGAVILEPDQQRVEIDQPEQLAPQQPARPGDIEGRGSQGPVEAAAQAALPETETGRRETEKASDGERGLPYVSIPV